MKSVDAPVRDYSKNVTAAVGAVAPANRLRASHLVLGGIAAKVQDTAMALSLKLGSVPGAVKKQRAGKRPAGKDFIDTSVRAVVLSPQCRTMKSGTGCGPCCAR